jgi:dihydrolipoamide dehydrogenase
MPETKKCDTVVIGAGPAGYVCAIRLGQLGVDVILVEKEYLGGVCLNAGCIPSKALIHAAKQADHVAKAAAMGINAKLESLDMAKMQEWKGGIVKKLTGGVGQLVKGNGGAVVMGTARLTSANTVEVKSSDGATTVIECRNVVVASGSRPIQIPGFEFDEQFVLSSTGALALSKLPKDLVVIGGGYIGLELGITYAKLGSKVTVVEMMDQVLPGFSKDVVKVLERQMKKLGMVTMLGAKAKSQSKPAKAGAQGSVTIEVDGKDQVLPCDAVVVAVGRRPNWENLGLKEVGVTVTDRGFVPSDARKRTNVPNIYSIGDLAGDPMLAHKGSKEGEVCAEVIAGRPAEYDVKAIPAVVFTDPEIATVGLTEEAARKKGADVAIGKFPYAALGRALSTNETDGFVKILSDKRTDVIVGCEIVGADASSLIAEMALAVEMSASVQDVALTVHAHPTFPESLMEAAKAIHHEAIHVMNK